MITRLKCKPPFHADVAVMESTLAPINHAISTLFSHSTPTGFPGRFTGGRITEPQATEWHKCYWP